MTGLFSSMRIKTQVWIFAGLASVMVAVICLYTLLSVRALNERTTEHFNTTVLMYESVVAALNTEIHFMQQVREWNNVLLRGYDEPSYDRHLQSFRDEEKTVGASLEKLSNLMARAGLDTSKVGHALQAHRDLGARYRDGLK